MMLLGNRRRKRVHLKRSSCSSVKSLKGMRDGSEEGIPDCFVGEGSSQGHGVEVE